MSHTAIILVSLIVFSFGIFTNGVEQTTASQNKLLREDPSWNYLNHGTDWDFESCNLSADVQSPLTIDTSAITFAWDQYTPVSFLTGWQTAAIAAEDHGVSNYTYRINATDSNMGVFYACETYLSEAQIQWDVEQVRFKYPSEHIIDGQVFDLEMQVILNDTLSRANYCSGHKGTLSIMFNIDETPNDFWDWVGQETFDFDLTKVFTKTTSMEALMVGYGGTDSEPNCTRIWCWYLTVLPTVMTIPQAKFDALKAPGVEFNNRAVDLGLHPNALAVKMEGLFYQAPTDEL